MSEIKKTINEQIQQIQMFRRRSRLSRNGGNRDPHRGQGRVLSLLMLKPEMSQKELTYLLNMSKQAVAELLGKLEKIGYITREHNEDDKRVMMVKLTEEGKAAANSAKANSTEALSVFDCLSEEELNTFSGYLERILKQYEEMYPEEDYEERRKMMEDFMLHHKGEHRHHRHHGRRHAESSRDKHHHGETE